jgi:heterodisulfide reductase subunit C
MNHSDKPETFADQVHAAPGGEHLMHCFSCGTCVATCPIQWIEENYNPRRIIKMVMLGMKDEVLSSPVIWLCSACDICYRRCPQGVHISDVMKAIREVAIQEGYEPVRAIAQVNEEACAGCGMCAQACPYEAIRLTTAWDMGQPSTVPAVDRFLCHGCGVCAATCPSSAISLTDVSDETILAQIREFAEVTG